MRKSGRPGVVLAGAAGQNPEYGGHKWVFLNYLLGFRRLGYDVLLLDQVPQSDSSGRHLLTRQLRRLAHALGRFKLGDAYSVLGPDGRAIAGVERAEVINRVREADAVINVMGYLRDEELLAASNRRVFLDIDPGFPQMWHSLGQADVLSGHHAYVTVGTALGRPGCQIPTCDLPWIDTRPPVVLEHWPARAPSEPVAFMSIGAWRGPFDPIEFNDCRHGLRAHEFRRLAALPSQVPAPFRAALDLDESDHADRQLLTEWGWNLLDPAAETGDPWRYRRLIGSSGAELMVAKQLYVATRSGWFSDRSACFLASGKPVLALDTGFPREWLEGPGLVAFDSLQTAGEGARDILANYPEHARGAREVAERWFDSDLVLAELMDRISAA